MTAMMVFAGTAVVPAWGAFHDVPPSFAGGREEQAVSEGNSLRGSRELENQSMNSVWLLPDSDTYYISESDVSWMDDNELMLARNEFYARRGRKFVTRSIREYFNSQGWYHGYIEPEDFSPDLFNRYEQANVDFIVAYENRRSEIRRQQAEEPQEQPALDGENPTSEREADAALYGELYGGITDLYRDAIAEGWSDEDYEIAGMNGLAAGFETAGELGYIFRDLDGDENGELLIGPADPQICGQGAVFEIYTVLDGIPVEVAAADENTSYYICEDNTICREVKMADGNWELDYLELDGADLVCREVLLLDEGLDAGAPWFVIRHAEEFEQDADGTLSGVTAEDCSSISYKDASELRASYAADTLVLIPLGEE
mgnify:CR=1 FL=1